MSIGKKLLTVTCLLTLGAGSALAESAGDATKGEKVYKKCMACHKVGEGAKNTVGPQLNDLLGRKAASVEGFRYSKLLKAAGENELVWTEETLMEYLPDPKGYLKKALTDAGKADQAKGSSRMSFRLKNEQQRRDVIAYLKQFSKEQ